MTNQLRGRSDDQHKHMQAMDVSELSAMGVNVSLPKVGSLSNISPSSTMDELPFQKDAAKAPQRRTLSQGARHTLEVAENGVATARGGSRLEEEGEMFLAHLGTGGDEWGEPLASPRTVILPPAAGACVEVAAGDLHSLFLCASGAVFSCGGGWEGPLGHGDEASIRIARPIAALASVHVERIAAGGAHSLAIADGRLYSFGWNRFGQCGHGDEQKILTPRRVEGLEGVVQVRRRGPGTPPNVLTNHASLAFSPPKLDIFSPRPLRAQVAAGRSHSLALCVGGATFAFGQTTAGQCGHGASGDAAAPVRRPCRVTAFEGQAVVEVLASGDASAALVAGPAEASVLYQWGAAPSMPAPVALPTRVDGLGSPAALFAGPGA